MKKMTAAEYQTLAARTFAHLPSVEDDLIHMVAGIVGEFGEIVDLLKKSFAYGKELDRKELIKELGDFTWYSSQLYTLYEEEYEMDECEEYFFLTGQEAVRGALLHSLNVMPAIAEAADVTPTLEWNCNAGKANSRIFRLLDTLFTFPSEICQFFGIQIHEVLEANIKKLEARYPDLRFDADRAINRDHDAEDVAVNGGVSGGENK